MNIVAKTQQKAAHGYAKVGSVVQTPADIIAGGPGGVISRAATRPARLTPAPPDPTKQNLDGFLGKEREAFRQAEGALQTFGAVMGMVTGLEQAISKPFMSVPFPALPALRVGDADVGLPHGHLHAPNFVPPAPMVMLPSIGPVIKIPYVSGADNTLINGRPAARCGDMGLGIWCGGFVPMFEVFLGSASVWIEGSRAARMGVDITNHCTFSARKTKDDKPIGSFLGTTIEGSPNVLIGGMPMPSFTNMAMGLAFRGAGRVVKALATTKPGKALTTKIGVMGKKARDAVKKALKRDAADTATDMTPAGLADAGATTGRMDALDIMLHQFPDEVRDIIRRSPTLSDQLRQLHGRGWSVNRGPHASELSRSGKQIKIKEGPPMQEVGSLGHEAGHAVGPPPPHIPKQGLSEGEFVQRRVDDNMADEGRAQFNEAKVLDEIRSNGGPDGRMSGNHSDAYDEIYHRQKDGRISEDQAKQEMADRMRDDTTGSTNEEYLDFYAKHARREFNEP